MSYIIKEVTNKRQIHDFVVFQIKHFKKNNYYVPPLVSDEVNSFLPEKNPGIKDVDLKLFLCYKGNKIVGRVGALISHPANKKYSYKNCRFSWIDFIDDYEVCKLLLDAVVKFAKEKGMTSITGPHGLNDFEKQGMLIMGFDQMVTMASFYNYDYYPKYIEKYGFKKEVDYVEYISKIPQNEEVPEKLERIKDYIMKKYNLKLVSYKSNKDYVKRGEEIFKLLDESYQYNYGTVPITDEQRIYYIKKYLPFLNPKLIKLIENEKNELVGFIIAMPSLSKAMQKANGKLFPFGIFHIMKGIKTYDILDFYFAGVRDDYRSLGIDAVLATEIVKMTIEMKFKFAESNQMLENNKLVQAMWKFYKPINHKRRRIFKLII